MAFGVKAEQSGGSAQSLPQGSVPGGSAQSLPQGSVPDPQQSLPQGSAADNAASPSLGGSSTDPVKTKLEQQLDALAHERAELNKEISANIKGGTFKSWWKAALESHRFCDQKVGVSFGELLKQTGTP